MKKFMEWSEKLNITVTNTGISNGKKLYKIGEKDYEINQPITFTPYASSKPCSANCPFCSELLIRKGKEKLACRTKININYFNNLCDVLAELKGLKIGLSFSGLEYTEDKEWMKEVFKIIKNKEKSGMEITEKVLYTNGSGFLDIVESEIKEIMSVQLDKIELSRHHYNEEKCNKIMRFSKGKEIRKNSNFIRVIEKIKKYTNIRLVCVLQKNGINSIEEVENYLELVKKAGVKEVVFRELCIPGDDFQENTVYKYINNERVSIEGIVDKIIRENEYTVQEIINGYYYQNISFIYMNKIKVTFEKSDYREMSKKHNSERIYKFVFWGNGILSSDWDPESKVIYDANKK